jgi:hypothetical protein
MRNVGSVTPNLGRDMGSLRDDELDAVSGGRKTSTAKTKAKAFEDFVQDDMVTFDELVTIHSM